MRKTRVALAGVVVGGLLLVGPAAANAKEFQFQGGSEPFGSNPPVGMTMTGKKAKHPKRLTGFAVEVTYDCGAIGTDTQTERIPIEHNPQDAKIRRNKKKDLTFFDWSYDFIYRPGVTLESWQLVGGQHRKHPKVWRGKVRIRKSEGGIEFGYCALQGADDDGYVHWEAELVGND
jgi:hypothetical protein